MLRSIQIVVGGLILVCFTAESAVVRGDSARGGVTNQALKLVPNGTPSNLLLGEFLAIEGNVALAGAGLDSEFGNRAGAVYVFNLLAGQQVFKLTPGDIAAEDRFGQDVAIDNGIAIVGSQHDSGNGLHSGSAYLFDVTTGIELRKLLPDDGAPGDFFSVDVAIDGGVAVVGASGDDDNGDNSGSVYVFDVATGDQLMKLQPDDAEAGQTFGLEVDICGGVLAVGTIRDDENGEEAGAVYLFDVSTGDQLHKLLPADGAAGDWFGLSIGIDGGLVAVGAPMNDSAGDRSGLAYVFDVTTGAEIRKLLPHDAQGVDFFGWSVAIADGCIAVGAYGDDEMGSASGSVLVYDAFSGAAIAKLVASDGNVGDNLGYGAAIDGRVVIAGARGHSDLAFLGGAVYVFEISGEPCTLPDLNFDATVDTADLGILLGVFGGEGPRGDLNGDGISDTADLGILIGGFGLSCD